MVSLSASRAFDNQATSPCRIGIIFTKWYGKYCASICMQIVRRAPMFQFAFDEALLTFRSQGPALEPLYQLPPDRTEEPRLAQ